MSFKLYSPLQSLKDMCAKLVVDFEMDYRATCSDELSDWVERYFTSIALKMNCDLLIINCNKDPIT